jgi:hypothetical protein
MVKALINRFVLTHREGDFAQEQVAAIGGDLIEGAAQFEAIKHVGFDAGTKEQIEGFTRKKLWGQGQGVIGKPQTIEDHPLDRFTGDDCLL